MELTKDSVIEFPCDFPIKAMGLSTDPIENIFTKIARKHFPHMKSFNIKRQESSGGNYMSITIIIKALNREQLDNVYRDLSAHEKIMMTL